MGTFGAGLFENDAALDAAADISKHLETIINGFVDGIEIEDTESTMGYVAILTSLVRDCRGVPPTIAVVNSWREAVLRVFDSEIDALEPQEGYEEERRAVLARAFDELAALTRG